jgi:hypothetical protein
MFEVRRVEGEDADGGFKRTELVVLGLGVSILGLWQVLLVQVF